MTKRFTLLLAVAGTATGLFFVAPLAKGDDDKTNLQGTWKLETVKWAETDKTSSIFVSSVSYLIIKDDQMISRNEDGGKVKETKYSYTLDPKKKPAVYDQKALDGKNKGETSSGIYAINGDTLKMCNKSKGLPQDFEIVQGKEVKDKYLFIYKRVNK